jgi:hypothetical protein
MANAILQQFTKKESPWRFLKLALKLRAPEPAFGYVLVTLANHANSDGFCYPSYDLLLAETAYTSKQTITGALKHWKGAGVLTWKKGWGNIHKQRSNEYQFHEAVMEALVAQQKADRGNLSEVSDEISVRPEEISVRPDEISVGGGMKAHTVVPKVSGLEGPSYKTSQLPKEDAALPSNVDILTAESTATQAHVRQSSPDEISSKSSLSGISSPPYTVTPEPTLADVFRDLDPAMKKEHFRLTEDSPRAEQLRVALELLARQTLSNPTPNS